MYANISHAAQRTLAIKQESGRERADKTESSCGRKEQLSRWLQPYCSSAAVRQQQSCVSGTSPSI